MPSEKIKNLERRYKQTRDLKIGETVITTCLQTIEEGLAHIVAVYLKTI